MMIIQNEPPIYISEFWTPQEKKSALGKKEEKRLQNAFLWNFKIEMQIEVNCK